jgi:hypothetical protein
MDMMDMMATFETGSSMKENFVNETISTDTIHQEPDFTKKISSKTVCNFFYYFFIIYAILGCLSLMALIGTAVMSKTIPFGSIIAYSLTFAIATTTALFHYLVCSRALLK